MKFRLICITAGLMLNMATAYASQKVEVPEDELARDSVLPRFETAESVKLRNITTERRIELGAYYGWKIDEPIYNQTKAGLNIGYHWSESSAFILNYAKWFGGRNTQYTNQIQKVGKIDFGKIPNIDYSAYLDYEWELYYGKISLTKQGVGNIFIYPLIGVGGTKYVHKFYPGANIGIGQKFFFSRSLALRADLKIQYEQGPSPFLGGGRLSNTATSSPDPGLFEDKWTLGTLLEVGLTYLF